MVFARFGVPGKMLTIIPASYTKACELACVRITVSTLTGLVSLRDCGKDVYCHRFFSMYFSSLQYIPFWYASVKTQTF